MKKYELKWDDCCDVWFIYKDGLALYPISPYEDKESVEEIIVPELNTIHAIAVELLRKLKIYHEKTKELAMETLSREIVENNEDVKGIDKFITKAEKTLKIK